MLTFLGIGAQKAGTTWLYEQFRQHPHIKFPKGKELHFWDRPYTQTDVHNYLDQFSHHHCHQGEITPAYAILPPTTIYQIWRVAPNLKLIYIIRDPVEVIPSGMSLIAGVLENGYDAFNTTSDEDQKRWIENLYQASADLLRSFHDAQTSGAIPEKNLCVVRYTDLLHNLEPTIKRILDFIEIDPPQTFLDEIHAQHEKQRTYKSRHQHSPEKFHLDPDRIRHDLGFVYDAYELPDKVAQTQPETEK